MSRTFVAMILPGHGSYAVPTANRIDLLEALPVALDAALTGRIDLAAQIVHQNLASPIAAELAVEIAASLARADDEYRLVEQVEWVARSCAVELIYRECFAVGARGKALTPEVLAALCLAVKDTLCRDLGQKQWRVEISPWRAAMRGDLARSWLEIRGYDGCEVGRGFSLPTAIETLADTMTEAQTRAVVATLTPQQQVALQALLRQLAAGTP